MWVEFYDSVLGEIILNTDRIDGLKKGGNDHIEFLISGKWHYIYIPDEKIQEKVYNEIKKLIKPVKIME